MPAHRQTMQKTLFQVIKDPVHGTMQFTPEEANWIMPLIDSENLQRLRHIKQAGLCDWFFPGAVHTRFNHSVGCCYVASQIANKLHLPEAQKQTVMLACLLHDIGHGPFSHVFEHVFYKKCVQHEMWTPYFLAEFSDESFLRKANRHNKTLPITRQTFSLVEKLIMHKEKKHKLLADIVSSQLDADRLDYLLRDSYFCGVNYGEYDFRWLLHCLTLIKEKGLKRLGVNATGVGVVEHYLMARRLMTQNVYQHAKKHAAEFLLTQFLAYLAKGLMEDVQFFEEIEHKTLTKFIVEVNQLNQSVKRSKQPRPIIKRFLKNNYNLYKQLCDYDIFSMIRYCAHLNMNHAAVKLAKRLQRRELPMVFRIQTKHYREAKQWVKMLREKHDISDWQLAVLHQPHRSYQTEEDPILVQDENGKIKRLHERSLVMRALSDQWENASVVCVDREIYQHTAVKKLCEKLRKLQ